MDLKDKFPPYKIKRAIFDGMPKILMKEAFGITLVNNTFTKLRKRYRGLYFYCLIRYIKAQTLEDVAEYLHTSKQNIHILIRNCGVGSLIYKKLRRVRYGLGPKLLRKPGILQATDKRGKKVLLYGTSLYALRLSNRNKHTNFRLVKYCKNSKLECFRLRFNKPDYKLDHETRRHFPGLNMHPPSGRWRAKYGRENLGYHVTLADGINAIKDFVLFGKIRPAQKGKCLTKKDKRTKRFRAKR